MMDTNLTLPDVLITLIGKRRWKRPRNLDRLAEVSGFRQVNRLDFLKAEKMVQETNALIALEESEHADLYSLVRSEEDKKLRDDPSKLDVRLAIVIANNWDEEGIVLDYRPGLDRPRVLAGMWPDDQDTPMRWKVIAKDIESFLELIGVQTGR